MVLAMTPVKPPVRKLKMKYCIFYSLWLIIAYNIRGKILIIYIYIGRIYIGILIYLV